MLYKIRSLGYFAAWLSVIINVALFIFKYWAGAEVGSVAMRADAWHTLSDTMTSLIVLLGLWVSTKPADSKHPFGHGRAEPIAAIMVGTLLAIVGFNFLNESVIRIQSHGAVKYSELSIMIFFASVLVKEAMAQFSMWAGKKINSDALIADGWHHRSDALTSAMVVIGAVAGGSMWWIDGVMGMVVSLSIFYVSYKIMRGVASLLLGETPDPEFENRIKNLVMVTAPSVLHVHHLHVHRYGEHIELTLHIMLPSGMRLKDVHDIASSIEESLRKEMKIEATIHVDPIDGSLGIS